METNQQTIVLRGYPKEIQEVLKCEPHIAEQVFSKMCQYDFDFSLSSQRMFVKTAKVALAEIQSV